MASREFSEWELNAQVARHRDVAVGIVDVKSYYIETPEVIAARVRRAIDIGLTEREAVDVVSRLTGEPVAVVRSLWVASTEAVAS
jgi:methionine synthase II (cobalamin-independent)